MGQFSVQENISRPVEEVWDALTDWGRASQWMGTGDLRPVATGPVGSGTRLTFEARGAERESEIVAWEPPKRMALRSKQGGMTAVYEYRCEGQGAGTEVTLDARCWGTGFLWKMLAPLIGILMKRTDSGQLIALRKMIEGDDGGR